MSDFNKVQLTVLAAALLAGCSNTISHPASWSHRLSYLTSEMVRQEHDCLSEKGHYCSFDEQHLTVLQRWGDFRIQTPLQASFEVYDLQLLVSAKGFCIAAFPTRLAQTDSAVWKDSRGREYYTKYPWREIPAECDLPNRPRLRVE